MPNLRLDTPQVLFIIVALLSIAGVALFHGRYIVSLALAGAAGAIALLGMMVSIINRKDNERKGRSWPM